ncbi:MAG: 50S ribosomal protein L11 methyltransferase [Bacteroidales bacterium]|nr:50S ribosomal protein L11 methyltransferase [Candidatus Liminaster caballi]
MNYIELTVSIDPMSEDNADILAAMLAPLGYDSFSTEEDCLKAYCPQNMFDAYSLTDCLAEFPIDGVKFDWWQHEVETQDWNAQWESEHATEPIAFGEHTIVIHPHMSFGSGHHETTSQLLGEIGRQQLDGRTVLDMGTGTGVLAIAAALKGATHVRAIEIDDWVADNARDNVLANDLAGRIVVECGDAALLADGMMYDLVLANINRNVLLADMEAYVSHMNSQATLLMSGFYEADVPAIRQCAEALGLTYIAHQSMNDWVVIRFQKN